MASSPFPLTAQYHKLRVCSPCTSWPVFSVTVGRSVNVGKWESRTTLSAMLPKTDRATRSRLASSSSPQAALFFKPLPPLHDLVPVSPVGFVHGIHWLAPNHQGLVASISHLTMSVTRMGLSSVKSLNPLLSSLVG